VIKSKRGTTAYGGNTFARKRNKVNTFTDSNQDYYIHSDSKKYTKYRCFNLLVDNWGFILNKHRGRAQEIVDA